MKKTIKALLAVMSITMFPMVTIFADSAIYFCDETGSYGAAWSIPITQAKQTALNYCQEQGGTNCTELISCEDTGFGAIAISSNEVIGAACGYNTQTQANQAAINSCVQSDGEDCTVKHTWNG